MKNIPADLFLSSLSNGEFCSAMNHDVRNSMNAIMGFAQILHEQPVTDTETREYAQIIFNESKYLLEYFDRMMKVVMTLPSDSRKTECEAYK
ncbi:MAG TPA: histidine kinase dimerization/phospho-acceptor domain-containing protein [Bacteroidales bacterium]|nr:histidine kinase dimerization/phospho-acceptor domain-containing protein [Bacteroidales bacterium]